jgi:hypothetical protein
MKYLLLVYGEEEKMMQVDDLSCLAFDKSIRDSGHCVASEALQPVATATTVRVRGGKASVTDGPFAETKEQFGGYFRVDDESLDESLDGALEWALEWARPIPVAGYGSVEVRPVWFHPEHGEPEA